MGIQGVTMLKSDALALEYKLVNGTACGNLRLSDSVNNPVGLGVAWISGYGLAEQLSDFLGSQLRAVRDDADLMSDITKIECDHCEEFLVATKEPYNYTRLSGLDPHEYTVMLSGINVYRCACGLAPEIPNVEGLQYAIGVALVMLDEPIKASGIKFLRKSLGLRQVDFAKMCAITPEWLSTVENAREKLSEPTETKMRLAFLSCLLGKPDVANHFDWPDLAAVIKKMAARTDKWISGSHQQRIDIGCPPAWMIMSESWPQESPCPSGGISGVSEKRGS
jgi:transcriptional regulator with XRE-family HTH domain